MRRCRPRRNASRQSYLHNPGQDMPPQQLFRQEAIDAQREKFLGEATIARPVPAWVFTALAAGIALLLISVAPWREHTRREGGEGYIALHTGAAPVASPDAGRITALLIKEGEEVKAGD